MQLTKLSIVKYVFRPLENSGWLLFILIIFLKEKSKSYK